MLHILPKPCKSKITCKFDVPTGFKRESGAKVIVMVTYTNAKKLPDQIESISLNGEKVVEIERINDK